MIEPLESRIAPAAALTFTDIDGDLVTVSISKGTLSQLQAAVGDLSDNRLQVFSANIAFNFGNLSITAKPQNGQGDGFVNVGRINAAGVVLGSVVVDGDLGEIDVGTFLTSPVAMQSLTVQSLGLFGTLTGAADLRSDIAGSVKAITIKNDLVDAKVDIYGGSDPNYASLGALTIGGSLRTTTGSGLASFEVDGNIGAIKIGGSVVGGAASSATIGSVHGSIASLTVGGDVIGGSAGFSGYIYADKNVGNVTIGGDLRGGGNSGAGNAGLILAGNGNMGNVKIGGSIIGGAGVYSGTVAASTGAGATGTMGHVVVGGSIIGGTANYSGTLISHGKIGSVTVGGNLEGGTQTDSGSILTIGGDIGNVSIRGSIIGGGTFSGAIYTSISDNAAGRIGTVKIGGDVRGGAGVGSGGIFANVSLGNVTVVGDLIGTVGSTGVIGTYASDVPLKIGNVTIGGSVTGGSGASSGGIYGSGYSEDSAGNIKVGGDWTAGAGQHSGRIFVGKVGSITLGGSLQGGSAWFAGYWSFNEAGAIKIGGDVIGGSEAQAGTISFFSSPSVWIGGSIIGGTGTQAGRVVGDAGSVYVGHDIRGGDAAADNRQGNGSLALGKVGSIVVGGSLIVGEETGAGELTENGAISVGSAGSITIKGSVIGSTDVTATIQGITAIKSLTIGGRVELAHILTTGANSQIGAVKVGGDWIRSNLTAGVNFGSQVGDGNDTAVGGADNLVSKIASITIASQVHGIISNLPSTVTYGFGAEQIGSFKVGGVALPLKSGAHNDTFGALGQAGSAVPVGVSSSSVISDSRAVHVFEV